jgi:putative FmdB family regulatory protein
MPLYEYRCHKCGKSFEVIQKFSDEPLTAHPDCGGEVERLISAPALQFKGSGWYITDYAKSGSTSKTESKSGSGDSKTETKKAESSPAPGTSSTPPASSSSSSSSSDSGSKSS